MNAAPMNATAARLTALGRAELTLLGRNRNTLFVALLMPVLMIFLLRSSLTGLSGGPGGAERLPMGIAAATLVGGTGMILMLVVYMSLVSTYVARREELVLKRLRTGEARDPEILAGGALPAVVIALVQCAVLSALGPAVLDVAAPRRPDLLVLGVLGAVPLLAALAALTTVITRTVESAGLTTLPFFLLSATGSGLMVPTDSLPDPVAAVCSVLPLSGAMELVRAGWLGGGDGKELLGAVLTTVAWIVISVFAVRKWFRWEPRR
ncbi:ABC transporter permease [Streptomyces sp. SKN60]|uniref:ABC transporter permease n=1 Tax=Streptomyces sp. SKN60 TaxID=2855506 RepID=UPI002247B868|nr:ABC transporter permease [Streptomyces sp. SKN60]MCX2178996.1 ABC transporter permease [Streptomyces sp. SKN60]